MILKEETVDLVLPIKNSMKKYKRPTLKEIRNTLQVLKDVVKTKSNKFTKTELTAMNNQIMALEWVVGEDEGFVHPIH